MFSENPNKIKSVVVYVFFFGTGIAKVEEMKTLAFIFFFFFSFSMASAGYDSLPAEENRLKIQEGVASYYGKRFHNRKTASGEVFDMHELTAAHKNLPFGTLLKVTNLKNGREVWVRINDRLPQSSKRVIDLSRAAAEALDMIRDGITQVRIEVTEDEVILDLIEHFQENKPEDLRLRPYEKPLEIEWDRSDILLRLPIGLNFSNSLALSR